MKKSYINYIFALLLFGSNGIVASHISLNSYEIVFYRTLLGSLLLLCIFLLQKKHFNLKQNPKDALFIALSGIAMGTSWMFLYEAYSRIGVSISSLLYYTGPLIVIVLSPILFKERLTFRKLFGLCIVLLGIVLLNEKNTTSSSNVLGIYCGLMAAIMYAVMVIANKKCRNIKGMENSLLQLLCSFFTVAIFVGYKTGYSIVIHNTDWCWILLLGFLNTGMGCYLYFSSINMLPIQTVAVCGYLEPLSAVLFSVVLLHETLTPIQICGAIAVIGGAMLSEICYKKAK